MSRQVSTPTTPSTTTTAAATVSVKKVTFSQSTPSSRGRQSRAGENATSAGGTAAAAAVSSSDDDDDDVDKDHRARSAVGKKRPRKHLVDVKKTMDKPLLPATAAATATSDKTSAATEPLLSSTDDQPTSGTGAADPTDGTWNATCPDYFGVKSYLHHFYETVSVQNPDLYEEMEGGCKAGGRQPPTKPFCRSVWWKVAVGCGANLLVIGIAVILVGKVLWQFKICHFYRYIYRKLRHVNYVRYDGRNRQDRDFAKKSLFNVGYFVPRRPIFVAHHNEVEVVDRSAVRYNYNLDVCKFVGLVVFCIGGITVTVALLVPSFLYEYCDQDSSPPVPELLKQQPLDNSDDDDDDDEDDITLGPPGSPTEKKPVPATASVTSIQPVWNPQDGTSALPSR